MSDPSPESPTKDENQNQVLTITLHTPLGLLKGNLAIPPHEIRLSELAWNLSALDEKQILMSTAFEAKLGRIASCKKGCGACCRQLVPLSPPEAWLLHDLVTSFPADRRSIVLERFSRNRERLKQEGFDRRSLHSMSTLEQLLDVGLDYFRLGLACPFLEEESCTIYRYRPASCREYLVASPASYCADPGLNPVQPLPFALNLTQALARLAAAIFDWEPMVIPMALALEWAEEHWEEGSQRFDPTSLIALLVDVISRPTLVRAK
jgi:Fe-S-cluster containining protein